MFDCGVDMELKYDDDNENDASFDVDNENIDNNGEVINDDVL